MSLEIIYEQVKPIRSVVLKTPSYSLPLTFSNGNRDNIIINWNLQGNYSYSKEDVKNLALALLQLVEQ